MRVRDTDPKRPIIKHRSPAVAHSRANSLIRAALTRIPTFSNSNHIYIYFLHTVCVCVTRVCSVYTLL